jgi:epsilon-lactone hydrolase
MRWMNFPNPRQHAGALVATAAVFAILECPSTYGAEEGSINVKAFQLPRYSDLLSPETRAGIERMNALRKASAERCDPSTKSTGKEIRACEALLYPPIIAEARKIYNVRMEARMIGGVHTDIVTPADGVPGQNKHRVLINIHGGGFQFGARFVGQLEAMPIAALGKYKVVAVDYRMAPENHFPAASVDIAAVYAELLKEYDASAIGLYGCSAGGRIVGQTTAWLAAQNLPRPGAIAILCSPPTGFGGDSNVIVAALRDSKPLVRKFDEGYFKGVRPTDPVAFPGDADEPLKKFPATLLMTSTRDYSLSPMVHMHARLVRLGIPTELHIFEGLGHGEFLNMYIPESRHAARVISAFFDTRLATASR